MHSDCKPSDDFGNDAKNQRLDITSDRIGSSSAPAQVAAGKLSINQRRTSISDRRMSSALIRITSLILLVLVSSFMTELAWATMSLPDGIENILGFIPRSSFKCERDGYFGDIDNDCRIFHLCQKQINQNGKVEWRHWTYACGNQTMFNQLTLTCAFVDEAIPCKHATQFQYLNEVIHKPREPFLTDADVTSGISYYTNRVMSDGARNRAFEDSNLMAQLGGMASFVEPSTMNANNHQDQQQFSSQSLSSSSFNYFNNFNHESNLNTQSPFPVTISGNSIDTSEQSSSSRTINSIELPEPSVSSLSNTFQTLSKRASSSSLEENDINTNNRQQDNLILVNRQPDHQFFQSQNLPETRFSQMIPAAPIPEPQTTTSVVATTTLAPQPTTTTTTTRTQEQPSDQVNLRSAAAGSAQLQQVNPSTFDFFISTSHQRDSSYPSTSFIHHHQEQQQQPTDNLFQTTSSTNAQATQAPTLQTTVISDAQATTNTEAPQESVPARPATTTTTTTTASSTTTAATTTTTTTTNAPTTTTQASNPTTTIESQSPATSASRVTRHQQQQRQRSRLAGSRSANNRNSFNQLSDAYPMRHFQSNRISAANKAQQIESSIVMRKQPTRAQESSASPSSTGSGGETNLVNSLSAAPIESADTLWSHPFDFQLFAPRFESLMMRRRV